DPESKELLDVIARNVDYMKHLVEKTLQLATISSMENASFDISKVRLSRAVDDLIKRKEYQFTQNNVTVENRIEQDVTVSADKLRLLEVFDNLASNAIKFMPRGGNLTFDTQVNGEFAIVNVSDTGIGISSVQMGHIFDEFYKADQSRHDLDSSGLGLTICRRIVEKHGGGIWAESEGLGSGTVFSFTIPLHVRAFGQDALCARQ
ncbi:MAG: HAMP domain-containing histidine kinase, partial [Chloroflexi bacterium]|nr:HAMP domain-containing histidine kinase [Chloroflexota bacterium]